MKSNINNTFILPIIFTLITLNPINLLSQNVAINNDGSAPNSTAILDVKSGTKGLLIPRMDSVARKAIVNPAKGLIVFDTSYDALYYYTQGRWNSVGSDASTIAFRAIRKTNFTTAFSTAMPFDSIEYNIGGGFSGGYFYAPVDGTYHFDVAAAIQTSSLYMQLSLYKNSGGMNTRPFTNLIRPQDGFNQTDLINITLLLKKNDVISIWIEPGSAAATVIGTSFDLTYFDGFKVN